jgi:NTP pyrophosphatase (non-canonical NTP hydrolase)
MDSIYELQHTVQEDSEEWFPNHAHDTPYLVLCLAGEVGELCNEIKKVLRSGNEYDQELHLKIAFELADIQIYLAMVANQFNVHLGEVYEIKRRLNVERFAGNGRGSSPVDDGVQFLMQQPDAEG